MSLKKKNFIFPRNASRAEKPTNPSKSRRMAALAAVEVDFRKLQVVAAAFRQQQQELILVVS